MEIRQDASLVRDGKMQMQCLRVVLAIVAACAVSLWPGQAMARNIATTGLVDDVDVSSVTEAENRSSQTSSSSKVTLDQALEIPADMLAQSYLVTKTRLAFLAMIENSNIELVTPEGRVDRSDSSSFRQRIEQRLAIYREAIERRDFANHLAGEYSVVSVAPSCATTQAVLFGAASEGVFARLTITQVDFEITLNGTVPAKPSEGLMEDLDLPFEGVVAEQALALADFANSDLFYHGEVVGDTIEIRPDPTVVGSWPAWASPPQREDLENCLLVLERSR